MQGGDYIHVLIIIIVSLLLSYNLISYYFISKKAKYVITKKNKFITKINFKFLDNYFKKIDENLNSIGNPYGLTLKKYILIKYFISSFLFIVQLFNSKNILVSFLLLIVFFLLPDILIKTYKRTESIQLINEISNIVQNIILSLSANMSLYDSLKSSIDCINNKRFKYEYTNFINNYIMYNFNIVKASGDFQKKFSSYEFNMFLSILIQGEKEGNMLELLESFSGSMDLMYFKFLKYKAARKTFVIIFSTVISMANSFLIVLYPIIIQLVDNFSNIFK